MALRNNDPSRASLEDKVDLVLKTTAKEPVDVDDAHRNVDEWLEADRRFQRQQLEQS